MLIEDIPPYHVACVAFGNNIVPALIPGQQDQFFTQRNPVGSGPSSLASTATCVCSSALVAMARIEDSPPTPKKNGFVEESY